MTDKQVIAAGEDKIVSVPIELIKDVNPLYIYISIQFKFEDNSTSAVKEFKYGHQTTQLVSNLFKVAVEVDSKGAVKSDTISDEAKLADVDSSGCVNTLDYSKVVVKYGVDTEANPDSADINSDGIINGLDLTYVLSHWNEGERCN